MLTKSLAKRSNGAVVVANAQKSLTLLEAPIAEFVQPFTIASRTKLELDRLGLTCGCDEFSSGRSLRDLTERERQFVPQWLKKAWPVHNDLLANAAKIGAAYHALLPVSINIDHEPIARPQALAMTSVLFGTLNKRKAEDENAAALLASCVDMLSPMHNVIGEITGLWEAVPRHPLFVALGIKRLLASSVFAPSPSELLEAIKLAHEKIGRLVWYLECAREFLNEADEIVFLFDRPAWDAAYEKVDSNVVWAVLGELLGEEPAEGEEEDELDYPGSPRWLVLNEMWERKQAAEAAAEKALPAREAACRTVPAKRTKRMPKREDAPIG